MADLPSGDPPVVVAVGAIEGPQDSIAVPSPAFEDEQTPADDDVTRSDAQATSDADDNPARSALEREQSATRREPSAKVRLTAARVRDATAQERDIAALARDHVAAARDLAMAQLDLAHEQEDDAHPVTGAALVIRACERRERAAEYRAQAAEHRALAAEDRRAAAEDRAEAARERRRAVEDYRALARELAIAAIDPLTGARTRAAGLTELDHELNRCRRTSGLLVVAYVDVVGLKALNDTKGHSAGDELLRRVVELIDEHLRSYDLIIRLGGDEFLCAMSNITLADARQRFKMIAARLGDAPCPATIRTGFAEFTSNQTIAELIELADSEMIDNRRARRTRGTRRQPARAVR